MPSCKKDKVLITGFGPFGTHKRNSSSEAVKILPSLSLPNNIELVTKLLPVEYQVIDAKIPKMWKKHKPRLVIHVGLSSMVDKITLEQCAYNKGYCKPDNKNYYPSSLCCKTSAPDTIISSINMQEISESDILKNNNISVNVSHEAGRYLCDYIFFSSLHHIHATSKTGVAAAFIHVPPLDLPFSAADLAHQLKVIIIAMLSQMDHVQEHAES